MDSDSPQEVWTFGIPPWVYFPLRESYYYSPLSSSVVSWGSDAVSWPVFAWFGLGLSFPPMANLNAEAFLDNIFQKVWGMTFTFEHATSVKKCFSQGGVEPWPQPRPNISALVDAASPHSLVEILPRGVEAVIAQYHSNYLYCIGYLSSVLLV